MRFTDLFTELVRAEIELWNELDTHLAATVGISLAQYQALAAIKNGAGQARVQDISTEMIITVGATSKIVDRLERDGFAGRSAHPHDRRSSIVLLSERGAAALAAAEETIESHLHTRLGGALSRDRAESLLIDLRSLRARPRVQAIP
jgi:DNA-binding MarR family transcriptional regulator